MKDHIVYVEIAPGELCASGAETEHDAKSISQDFLDKNLRTEIFKLAERPSLHKWKPKKIVGTKA